MSTQSEEIITPTETLSFSTKIQKLNENYLTLMDLLLEKFKYHPELSGNLESDVKIIRKKLETENDCILHFLTKQLLYCLEQVTDHNIDFFTYQKDKSIKKNGKTVKTKTTRVIGRVSLKKVFEESDQAFHILVFDHLYSLFVSLTVQEEGHYSFDKDYINFVKNHYTEDKNYSKMIMVIDNIDIILNQKIEHTVTAKPEKKDKKKSKKDKKKNSGMFDGLNAGFMNNLENTKIAQLAKNISEKMNKDDFPLLSDPSKLLGSLTGGGADGEGNLQNLLKFVVNEVEDAFKSTGMDEKELLGEAQGIMSQFQNMSGLDPMSLLKNFTGGEGGVPDMSQFENIFANLKK